MHDFITQKVEKSFRTLLQYAKVFHTNEQGSHEDFIWGITRLQEELGVSIYQIIEAGYGKLTQFTQHWSAIKYQAHRAEAENDPTRLQTCNTQADRVRRSCVKLVILISKLYEDMRPNNDNAVAASLACHAYRVLGSKLEGLFHFFRRAAGEAFPWETNGLRNNTHIEANPCAALAKHLEARHVVVILDRINRGTPELMAYTTASFRRDISLCTWPYTDNTLGNIIAEKDRYFQWLEQMPENLRSQVRLPAVPQGQDKKQAFQWLLQQLLYVLGKTSRTLIVNDELPALNVDDFGDWDWDGLAGEGGTVFGAANAGASENPVNDGNVLHGGIDENQDATVNNTVHVEDLVAPGGVFDFLAATGNAHDGGEDHVY